MIKEINGKTRLCGLLGYPVGHTLSPVIHNTLAEAMGKNLVYVPFSVEKDLSAAVRGAYGLNILGMNVTVPYKKDVMEALVEVDENAVKIGAVNTLVRTEGGFKGYNSDYLGLGRAIKEEKIRIAGRDVVVLGAGGAANAVVYLCAQSGAEHIYILNRTLEKAQKLAKQVAAYFPRCQIAAMEMKDYRNLPDKPMTCIQATSIGLFPNVDAAPIEDASFYKKFDQAVDIIYNPGETKFMKLVKNQGGRAINGLKMLLYQGVIAFELWNNVSVDQEACHRVQRLLEMELQK